MVHMYIVQGQWMIDWFRNDILWVWGWKRADVLTVVFLGTGEKVNAICLHDAYIWKRF